MFLNFNCRSLMAVDRRFTGRLLGADDVVPVPGIGAGSYAPDANLANWIDRNYLPGACGIPPAIPKAC